MRLLIAPLALLTAIGCQTGAADQDLAIVDGFGPTAIPTSGIYGGDAPDAPEHDATVALHEVFGGGSVFASPFCTGTLITEDVVLTAGHCVESWGGGVMAASDLAVYVGDDPSADLASHTYLVSEVLQHPDYNSFSLTGDIALLRLSSAVTEPVDPVAGLPSAEGFTNADEGMIVNFAGFGYQETGQYGVKQQVDLALGGLGCGGAPGCFGADPDTQVGYAQGAGAGPCSGDSGGPMFVYRGADTYVGGVTSYGDFSCSQYGVSTRVDAYETWINDFTGGGGTPPSGGICDSYDNSYSGTLSGSGDYDIHPGGSYYYASSNGYHTGHLEGDSGTDFDLYLWRWRSGAWQVTASSELGTSVEDIDDRNRRGYFLWTVESYSGSGDYELCTTTP